MLRRLLYISIFILAAASVASAQTVFKVNQVVSTTTNSVVGLPYSSGSPTGTFNLISTSTLAGILGTSSSYWAASPTTPTDVYNTNSAAVLIGTSTDFTSAYKLQVAGSAVFQDQNPTFYMRGSNSGSNLGGRIIMGNNAFATGTGSTIDFINCTFCSKINSSIDSIKETGANTGGAAASANALRFLNSFGIGPLQERMRITSSGNVGIGTSTPGAKLTVAGTTTATCFSTDGSTCIKTGPFNSDALHNILSYDSGSAGSGNGNFFAGEGVQGAGLATSAGQNVGIGYQSLYSNDASNANVALGSFSLYSVNGAGSYYNTAIGSQSLYGLTNGVGNIGIGFNVGTNLTAGTGNIILGDNIDFPSSGTNGQLDIGNFIYALGMTGSGGTVTTGGMMGVGTAAPSHTLEVNGDLVAGNVFGVKTVDTGGQTLTDPNSVLSVDWGLRQLKDAANTLSVDYNTRQLVNSVGSTILDYGGGSGYLQMNGNVNVTSGTYYQNGTVFGIPEAESNTGITPVADNTYTVGIGPTQNGTITTKNGIITAVQEAF